ncbi:MAG: glycoside hydrolase family 28 protein [Chloroflexi bacterium]|nr:MAG: glycoside hydrolase family 28 protein [Chloroflexota bacterium]
MAIYNILDFGAVGDSKTNNAAAIQKAIDTCSQSGGGKVIVPAGYIFMAGPFHLKSHVELHLEPNALLQASNDESLYTETPFRNNISEGSMWISARHQKNIAITGTGTINGSGRAFMHNEEPTHYNFKFVDGVDKRPHLLTLIGCQHITIRDVTFEDAAYWCIHPAGCEDVLIQGVRVYNSLRIRNCDGIDIDHCRNVRISDCDIRSADDCICIKNRREYAEYGPCENITVTGCVLTSTSCAIKLGSENVDDIQNVIFEACVIHGTNRGLGIQNRDEGNIENVIFNNIIIESRLFADVWWGKSEPIYVTAFKRAPGTKHRFKKGDTEGCIGKVRNIQFRNIICNSENGIYVSGTKGSRIEELLFENIRLRINKTTEHPGGLYDRRPCDVVGIIKRKTAGFYLNEADDITVRNCKVSWGNNRPAYYGYAIEAHDVHDFHLENFKGESAHPEQNQSLHIVDVADKEKGQGYTELTLQ